MPRMLQRCLLLPLLLPLLLVLLLLLLLLLLPSAAAAAAAPAAGAAAAAPCCCCCCCCCCPGCCCCGGGGGCCCNSSQSSLLYSKPVMYNSELDFSAETHHLTLATLQPVQAFVSLFREGHFDLPKCWLRLEIRWSPNHTLFPTTVARGSLDIYKRPFSICHDVMPAVFVCTTCADQYIIVERHARSAIGSKCWYRSVHIILFIISVPQN